MQNLFATAALLIWPVVAVILFSVLPLARAVLWTIMAGQLLLPAGAFIKFEGIPQFDKVSIPNLCLLACCLLFAGRWARLFSGSSAAGILVLVYLIGPIITSNNNGDAIFLGEVVIPGVGTYDGASASAAAFIALIPFFAGREFLRTAAGQREILYVLIVAGLFNSLPLLFEMRFSPQLQIWIYGFASAEWYQSVRDGGYRPVAFMGHGLIAAVFSLMSTVAAVTFWRARIAVHSIPPKNLAAYLGAVLLLCRSAGATVYAVLLVPLVYLARPKLQMLVAVALTTVAVTYPILRSQNLFPTNALVSAAEYISAERASSLKFRFDNEDILLARAFERPVFGWGRYGRSRVYTEDGRDLSVTDGRWIITFGELGFLGFIGEFGLLSLGIFRAWFALNRTEAPVERLFLSSLSLIVAVNMLDLLPNSALVPWTWLIAGALLGRADALLSQSKSRRAKELMVANAPASASP
jgi:hypothetical protein